MARGFLVRYRSFIMLTEAPVPTSRGGRIRTDDLLRPRQTRYQTALHPDEIQHLSWTPM